MKEGRKFMKKKLLAALIAGTMVFSMTACGGSTDTGNTSDTVETDDTDDADTTDDSASVGDAKDAIESDTEESGDFTLLDVTADLVDAAIYAVDDSNTEYVITLFRDYDGYSYISLMSVQEDGTGDVLCGPYDDSNVTNVTDEDNVDWTEITTTDVYTGDDFTAVFVEGDDGSVAVANADLSVVMEGQYLTEDEAIDYMGAAATYIQ